MSSVYRVFSSKNATSPRRIWTDLLSDWLFKGPFILKQAASGVKVPGPLTFQRSVTSPLFRHMTEGSQVVLCGFSFGLYLTWLLTTWPSRSSGCRSR